MRFLWMALACTSFLGCGDDGGGGAADAPPMVPTTITISGSATIKTATASDPAPGATVGAYRNGADATPIATAMTDAQGAYSLVIQTNDQVLDGYLKASLTGYLDTYLYPPKPIYADFNMASVYFISQNTLDLLSGFACLTMQNGGNGLIGTLVVDASNMAVVGAKVSSMPAAEKYCYDKGTTPSSSATMTDADGLAYMINVPAGQATVTASKTGLTFASHAVNARAGALTTTIIEP